jgi:ABC-2 type transport system permease protein
MTRLALRLDRVRVPVWLLVLIILPLSTASSFKTLYPTVQERLDLASGIQSNPTFLALYGRIYEPTTLGGLTAWRMGSSLPVLVAIMSLLLVVRHTRTEEQAGRLELVQSGVVGRRAPLTAAIVEVGAINLVAGLVIALALIGQKQGAAGAFAFGLSLTGVGLVFIGIAAVAAQLTENSRTAIGISVVAVAVSYALRAFGDGASASKGGGASWLSWLSPLGWAPLIRPYAHERWWVFGLMLGVAAALVAAAYALVAHRDHGAGLVQARPGPAQSTMDSPHALAWRLQRGSLLAWMIGYAVAGAAVGSAAKNVGNVVKDNTAVTQAFQRLGGAHAVIDAYLAAVLAILGMIGSAYTVQAALRLRSEEANRRVDPVLATPVNRLRWALSHLLFAYGGTVVVLGVLGLAAGLAHGLNTSDVGGQLPRVLAGALVVVPAAWVLASICVALFGLAPQWSAVGWGLLAAFFLISFFGAVVRLNHWVMDLSPYTHVPKVPGGSVPATPIVLLLAVAAVLAVVGLGSFRRRDVDA